MIYSKRGTWYLKEEGKNIKAFTSREAAEASLEPVPFHRQHVSESLKKVNSEYPGTLKELDDGEEEK